MKIIPDCSIKPLSECAAGQIMRSLSYDYEEYAICATIKDSHRRAIVRFSQDGPLYDIIEEPNEHMVLAYSGEAIWEVDHNGPYEPPLRNLFEVHGAMVCCNENWYLNVRPLDGFRARNRLQLEIKNGAIVPHNNQLNDIAVFGKWSLSLHDEGLPFESKVPMASFEYIAPNGAA